MDDLGDELSNRVEVEVKPQALMRFLDKNFLLKDEDERALLKVGSLLLDDLLDSARCLFVVFIRLQETVRSFHSWVDPYGAMAEIASIAKPASATLEFLGRILSFLEFYQSKQGLYSYT